MIKKIFLIALSFFIAVSPAYAGGYQYAPVVRVSLEQKIEIVKRQAATGKISNKEAARLIRWLVNQR